MNDKEILEKVAVSFKREELRNEKRIHIGRISAILLVLLMMTLSRFVFGPSLHLRFILILGLCILSISIAFILWNYYKSKEQSSLIKYFLVTLDLMFITLLLIIVRATMSRDIYDITTDIPGFLLIFFVNAMSGLRFDFRLSLYCAVASVMILFGFTVYDFQTHSITHPYLVMIAFFKSGVLLGVALVSGYIGMRARKIIIQNYREQEEKSYVMNMFGKYVAPEIRDQILDGRIPLDGQRAEATLLFADLRDFTSYVEHNDPKEVIRSMRAYFTAMQRAIRQHQGQVLQYVGDEIVAAFGVPLPYNGHAEQAILAALEMRKRLEDLNRKRRRNGKVEFKHGIGVHTGEVLVGNTGSEDQPSYALIGGTVNLASRLQELTKELDTEIIISADTQSRMSSDFTLKRLSPARVKGISRPVEIFTFAETK